MKYGHYSDNELPQNNFAKEYKTNKFGYRCPEFNPLPLGGKKVVVLGCSHTFGIGLDDGDIWVNQLIKLCNNSSLKFYNLGSPGASGDRLIRILYGTEKLLYPDIIIVCWPEPSRRERLENDRTVNVTAQSNSIFLKSENNETDKEVFLKNVFFLEKFAQHRDAKTFHCFAQEIMPITDKANVLYEKTLFSCYPRYDNHNLPGAVKDLNQPWVPAKDGIHYGPPHHKEFARLFYEKFKGKLR